MRGSLAVDWLKSINAVQEYAKKIKNQKLFDSCYAHLRTHFDPAFLQGDFTKANDRITPELFEQIDNYTPRPLTISAPSVTQE